MPRNEVIKRLRDRNQPIRFFGESDVDAAKRLKMIETNETETNGMRNDFKAAMDKTEQESVNELMNLVKSGEGGADVEVHDEAVDLQEIIELSKKPREKNNDSLMVLKYIKLIVRKWGHELNSRSREEKMNVKGRLEAALHSQTVTHLKPLCRKLKTKVDNLILNYWFLVICF